MRPLIFPAVAVAVLAITACAPPNYTTGYSGKIIKASEPATYQAVVPSSQPPAAVFDSVAARACSADTARNQPLTDYDIRACIDQSNGALQAIYQRGLRSDPTLKGAMVVDLRISAEGTVAYAAVEPGAELSPEIANKVLERIKTIRFPASPAGWEGKYTLNFFPS